MGHGINKKFPLGAGDTFKTVDVPSGTDPVASGVDTLTFTSTGATVTITGSGSNTINFEAAGGGGSSDSFRTIVPTAGDSVVADSATDTLTITSTGGTLAVTGTAASDTLNFEVVEANIDHDALSNFVANEHIDHTSVTLTAGLGISGGGDISANRSFAFDPSELSTATPASGDLFVFQDVDDTNLPKTVSLTNLTSAVDHGGLSGLSDDDHTQYLLLAGRSGGQTYYGGTAASDDLFIRSTSDATKGIIYMADEDGGTISMGDPGSEAGGINVDGTTYDSRLKVNDIGGSEPAQFHIHRHSTTLPSVLVGSRANSDTSSHAAVTSGQSVFDVYGVGWTSGHYDFFGGISIAASSSGTISGTSSPGTLSLLVVPDGTNTLTAGLTIDHTLDVSITGNTTIGGGSSASELRLLEPSGGGSSYVSFKSPALAANVNYTLPADDGDASEVLTTDGAGVLTWEAIPATGNSFETIVPTAGDSVVADSATDTLTLTSASGSISITGTGASDTLDFDVVEASVDHDALSNFVSDEHVAHTSVTLTAGLGISGGGDISANRSFAFEPSELATATPATGDLVIFQDIDDSNLPKKVTFSDLNAGMDHGTLAGLSDDDHSQYLLLAGRSGGQVATGGTGAGDDLTLRSTTNATKGDVIIQDEGGHVLIGGGTTASELRLFEPSGSGSNYTAFKSQAQAGDITYTLPASDASGALMSNGSGSLSWTAVTLPNSFETIDCPLGTDPVADSTTDTLTLVSDGGTVASGSNSLLITGDSGTDTITLSVRYNNPGAGASSEVFGVSAAAAGANSTAIGNAATAALSDSVAIGSAANAAGLFVGQNTVIGRSATTSASFGANTAIGYTATVSGGGSFNSTAVGNAVIAGGSAALAIGASTTASGSGALTMGSSSNISVGNDRCTVLGGSCNANNGTADDVVVIGNNTTSNFSSTLCIGTTATPTAANQAIIGGSGGAYDFFFLGKGVTNATPSAEVVITSTGETGTNEAGSSLVLRPGRSTGSYASTAGKFVVRTGIVGSSGTTLQSQEDRLTIYVGGTVVFNENSADADFRIESDGDANCFFLDGGLNQIGIGDATPVVKLDINGGTAWQSSGSATSLTADDQNVNAGDRSHIILSSDDATATNRTFTLSNGLGDGHMLIIEWSGTNAGEIVAASNIKLSATWAPTQYDTLSLMWSANASAWLEVSRSANA